VKIPYRLRHPTAAAGIAAFTVLGLSPGVSAQSVTLPTTSQIVGAWTLNKDLSDTPQDRSSSSGDGTTTGRGGGGRGGGGGFGGGGGGGFGGGGFGGRRRGGGGLGGGQGAGAQNPADAQRMHDAMREITDQPGHLTITQGDTLVIVTTGEGLTTRLAPNGKKIKDENTKIERKTKWDGDKLVSEINGLGPNKITESYAVDDEHHQLGVTVVMDGSHGQPPVTTHRVYDADTP
jgi:hypothetical protein